MKKELGELTFQVVRYFQSGQSKRRMDKNLLYCSERWAVLDAACLKLFIVSSPIFAAHASRFQCFNGKASVGFAGIQPAVSKSQPAFCMEDGFIFVIS